MSDVEEGLLEVGTTAKYLDTAVVEQTGGQAAHREAVVITDAIKNDNRVNVVELKRSGLYAQVVTDENSRSVMGTLEAIYEQNERIIMMLESIAE